MALFRMVGFEVTPFDMVVANGVSRFQLAIEALHHAPRLQSRLGEIICRFQEKLADHEAYVREHGEDLPEARNWRGES